MRVVLQGNADHVAAKFREPLWISETTRTADRSSVCSIPNSCFAAISRGLGINSAMSKVPGIMPICRASWNRGLGQAVDGALKTALSCANSFDRGSKEKIDLRLEPSGPAHRF